MCLYVKSEKQIELQPAAEDITVWKVLNCTRWGVSTPFLHYQVRAKTMVADGCCRPVYEAGPVKKRWWRISEGVIHSYAYKKDAERMAQRLKGVCGDHSIVVEATIPAGTPYILGEDAARRPSFGSTQLVLKNIEI